VLSTDGKGGGWTAVSKRKRFRLRLNQQRGVTRANPLKCRRPGSPHVVYPKKLKANTSDERGDSQGKESGLNQRKMPSDRKRKMAAPRKKVPNQKGDQPWGGRE